ncbi:unnamed protein product [Orchesella dallaii]|uniref:Uncharacterized protein n=1 Tax=Orchesella dallaii TaxID=48710 RepID=A0ABP1QSH1_9HEXA
MEQGDIDTTGMNLTEDSILREIEELENLKSEAAILSQWSGSSSFLENINILQNQWRNLLRAYRKSKDGGKGNPMSEAGAEDPVKVETATAGMVPQVVDEIKKTKPSGEGKNNVADQIVPSSPLSLNVTEKVVSVEPKEVEGDKTFVQANNKEVEGKMSPVKKSKESVVPPVPAVRKLLKTEKT